MTGGHAQSVTRRALAGACGGLIMLIGTARCGSSGPARPSSATLRVGVGGLAQQTQEAGLRPLMTDFSVEGLVALYEDGRLRPWLAESWTTSADRLSVTLNVRPKVKFHDATPLTASIVAKAFQQTLLGAPGSAFEDVDRIVAVDDLHLRIDLRKPSSFLLEALEAPIQLPGKPDIGTGPYIAASSSELRANPDYYLGRPNIGVVAFIAYPSVRTAWAELLRGNIDMLYEVNMDALDSLQHSSVVSVFSYVRHYQYVLMFGSHAAQLQDPEVRRELNAAIDREALIREALNGHGIASTGPIPPRHWALEPKAPKLKFDRQQAHRLTTRRLRFTCLIPADSVFERMSLAIKQQLAVAGVDMQIEQATQEQIMQAGRSNNFDAILVDVVSGPSIFRMYRYLYSKVPLTLKPRNSELIDSALDRIHHAASDDEYRAGVTALQEAIVKDPPALFLAWGERARAVSRKFDVVTEEKGRDIFHDLRLWRPTGAQQASTN